MICQRPCVIRHCTIGNNRWSRMALSLTAATSGALLEQARIDMDAQPDLLEWRADYFQAIDDTRETLKALTQLRKVSGNIPLIFTCRSAAEGGQRNLAAVYRFKLYLDVVASGQADLVDLELASDPSLICSIYQSCQNHQVKLILSYHNFEKTPPEADIEATLLAAQHLGADIAKVAVMPQTPQDVLTLLMATCRVRQSALEIPAIAIAMGELGKITRLAGALFGSDVTFAAGQSSSAPGQMSVEALRRGWGLLEGF